MSSEVKEVNLGGTCCFVVPLKPGAIAITVVSVCLHILSLILRPYLVCNIFSVILTVINIAGAYFIYANHLYGTMVYAWSNVVLLVASFIATMVVLNIMNCSLVLTDPNDIANCNRVKSIMQIEFGFSYALMGYFSYVVFEFAYKLRRMLSLPTNIELSRK